MERFALSTIKLLILFGIRRNCLRSQLLYLYSRRVNKEDCSNYRGTSFCQLRIKFYSICCYQNELQLLGIISVGFDATGQLMVIYSEFDKYLRKNWEYNEVVHQLFIDFKKPYDSVRKDDLYNILTEFGIPMQLVRQVKLCVNETYSRVRIAKRLSDVFHIKNGFKQGDV
jgi:hypothetical protein